MNFIKTTVLGGVVFLVPVVILAAVLGKAYHIMMLVAQPMSDIPFELVCVLHHPLQLEPPLLSLCNEGVGLVVLDPSRIFVVAEELVFEMVAWSIAPTSPHGTWQCCVFWYQRACGHLDHTDWDLELESLVSSST